MPHRRNVKYPSSACVTIGSPATLNDVFSSTGIPVRVAAVSDAGRHQIVETRHGDTVIRLLLDEHERVPADGAHVSFDAAFTQLYVDGWLAGGSTIQ